MSIHFAVYTGERDGVFSINSRAYQGQKLRVTRNHPFAIDEGDLWIASMRGYHLLSEVAFAPEVSRKWIDDTYLRRYDGAFLEGLAASCPDPARVVDIGRGRGHSLLRILFGLSLHQDVKVWSIDIEECQDAVDAVVTAGVPKWRYEVLLSDSLSAALAHHEPLDLVYADGRHSTEGVLEDAEVWGKHVKVGGLMVFHDYGDPDHAVTEGARAAMRGRQWKKVGAVGVVAAFEKMYEVENV